MQRRTVLSSAVLTATAAFGLSACSKSKTGTQKAADADPKAPVTITISGRPTPDNAASLKSFNAKVEAFKKKYPNVTAKTTEDKWDAQTFQAKIAAGTLPTIMGVPFTDIQSLIGRGQVADLTDYLAKDDVLSELNADTSKIAKKNGKSYGVVTAAYTMAISYNRALYKKAGLDPDTPPGSWDDLYNNTVAISQKTGTPGLVIATTDNVGGWIATTMSYGFGSLAQQGSGDSVKATLTSDGMKQALQFLQKVRWQGNAFGRNILQSNDDNSKAFGANRAGHVINGGDLYSRMITQFGMKPDDYGIGPIPQADNGLGALGGGTVQIISPKASANETLAGLNWIKFNSLQQYFDKDLAVSNAKASVADKLPVGVPILPVLSDKLNEQYLGWIKEYINVPRDHFDTYVESFSSLPIVPEPAVKGQETYASLDSVVQAVLGRKNADIAALLEKAQKDVQGQIDAA